MYAVVLSHDLFMIIGIVSHFYCIGEELADLIDCRTGLIMPQVPCKAFWNGFEDIQGLKTIYMKILLIYMYILSVFSSSQRSYTQRCSSVKTERLANW